MLAAEGGWCPGHAKYKQTAVMTFEKLVGGSGIPNANFIPCSILFIIIICFQERKPKIHFL